MSKLSYGINFKKPVTSSSARPAPGKRKTIFDNDSDPEDGPNERADNSEAITTIGDVHTKSHKSKPQPKLNNSHPPSRKPSKISQFGDLSTNHTTSKHALSAQSLDPSIYDYDAVYDSLHAPPPSKSDPSSAEVPQKPKYMTSLLAAAEVRKRDSLRAKEKLLVREREAEGDEFADKEKFVTAAYKRQQAEMIRLEAEEVEKEREAEERKRREGGGMKGLYKRILEKDEVRHQEVVKAVEENKGKRDIDVAEPEAPKEKSEGELAKEKGALVNEDGIVVDKRQLLSAGLNASKSAAARVTKPPDPRNKGMGRGREAEGKGRGCGGETSRERETRLFEEQLLGKSGGGRETSRERETQLFEESLLGKHGMEDDDEGDWRRASKSRKLEDEILGKLG